MLCRFQNKVHVYGVKGKEYQPFIGLLHYAYLEKRLNITMYGLYISLHAAGRFPNRHGACPRHDLEQLQPLPRNHLEKKFRRLETYEISLGFSVKRTNKPFVHCITG